MSYWDYLPAINSLWGFLLYSFIAYVFSLLVASFTTNYLTNEESKN